MPELPEVQTVIDSLRPRVLGATISRVILHRTDILTPASADLPKLLTHQTIGGLDRRGKRIIFTLQNGQKFYIHLGMSGRLGIHNHDEPLVRHTHLIISLIAEAPRPGASAHGYRRMRTKDSCEIELRFVDPRRFGGIWWLGHDQPADLNMGPEPLATRPAQLAKRLSKTTRAIKNALLDQTVIAGLGNIYVDESLHAAGIHPLIPANKLTPEQIARLSRSIKSTLRKALRHRGSTLRDYRDGNGQPGAFQSRHRVYDREGKPCRTCRTPIERIVLGGRSTHFCPECQKT